MKESKKRLQETIINRAVNSLHEFGYPNCNSENIFTDMVYSRCFKNMLKDNLGASDSMDNIINELIAKCDS